MATATTQRPLKGPAKRMSTWTMTREAITIGFDAGDGFLGGYAAATSPDFVVLADVLSRSVTPTTSTMCCTRPA